MEVYIQTPFPQTKEGSGFVSKTYFRDGDTASTPTTARYRVDCLTTGKTLTNWTSLTPAASIDITLNGTVNAIQDSCNRYEKKQITVEADTSLSTQSRDTATWKVENIRGF